MVAFSFSSAEMLAAGVKPWRGPPHEAPRDYALHLWLQLTNPDEDMDFWTACELAQIDKEVWEELIKAVQGADTSTWSHEALSALCAAVTAKPRRRGGGATARRNTRLRMVAAQLAQHYPKLPRKPGTGGVADIIAGLPGAVMSADSVYNNVLTGQ
ncbi:hypothetical protein [Leisingera sp. ANG59]|uniref:hypothetical protein n=1 Tax=Leisingera sp. ANG59 TaxID=2675221 RepID=UPI001572EE26|nr:hypothetical protein [Leisingera sp. ANG59]NSY41581.1 hypothetical protein [Leisingera sp. ANG59]